MFAVPDDEHAPIPPVNLGIQSGRFRYPPEGLFGGKPGAKARFEVDGEAGDPYGLTQLKPGDRVVMDAAGGGGYGDPFEREPDRVLSDVHEGYVSVEQARAQYGVVIDADTLSLNVEETRKSRDGAPDGEDS